MFKYITLLFMLTITQGLFAQQQQKPVLLYPDGVPDSKVTPADYTEKTDKDGHISMVSSPSLTIFFPEKGTANGTAIIIFPGGGYAYLSNKSEGTDVAAVFNKIGVTAFIVKSRLPDDRIMPDKTIGPLQDAQRAIQIVRQRAVEWGINPAKIGVIGFSAGGHLASTLSTHFDKAVIDNNDNVNLRPDFALLIYPVISFGPMAHGGSRDALIGKNATQEMIDLYSNEKQVTTNTPPTFLIHAEDDGAVPVQNSLLYYEALHRNKVKAEMHLYQAGGHGFGLINPKRKARWFDWATNWMSDSGWLNK